MAEKQNQPMFESQAYVRQSKGRKSATPVALPANVAERLAAFISAAENAGGDWRIYRRINGSTEFADRETADTMVATLRAYAKHAKINGARFEVHVIQLPESGYKVALRERSKRTLGYKAHPDPLAC